MLAGDTKIKNTVFNPNKCILHEYILLLFNITDNRVHIITVQSGYNKLCNTVN